MTLLVEIVAAMFISRVLYGAMRKWSDSHGYSLLKPIVSTLAVGAALVLVYFAIMFIWAEKVMQAEKKEPCHVEYQMCMPGQPRVNTPPDGLVLDLSKSVPITVPQNGQPPMPPGFLPIQPKYDLSCCVSH